MATYHLNVLSGSFVTIDEEGEEFPSEAAATHEARLAVLELAKDGLKDDLQSISVEVRDGAGRRVATVTASVSIE